MTPREMLMKAFLAGAADLNRRSALLDRINVFPVVDADTGANMSQTLKAGVDAIESGRRDIAADLLLGARGNSGVILAQFLVGFLDTLGSGDRFDLSKVRKAVATGRDLAYEAVSDPREGTMLTVMTVLRDTLDRSAQAFDMNSHAAMENTLAHAVRTTPDLMPRLREAGVVDSGALGFHVFICGLTLALPALDDPAAGIASIEARKTGDTVAPMGEIALSIDPGFLASGAADESRLRYCMNVALETTGDPGDKLAASFESLGASLDIIQRKNLIKLHVHCNDPEAVKSASARFGRIISVDVEDMSEGLVRVKAMSGETPIEARARRPLRVMSDSSMSLSEELARKHGVDRLENYVSVHGRMVRDRDLDRDALFAKMRDGHVFTTAQTSPQEVRLFLDGQLKEPGNVLYLAVGRPYTGTQELVRGVAGKHPEGERLTILDTSAASGQQGLAVLATAIRAQRENDLDVLVEFARYQIKTCVEYLVIDTLKYLSATGRIGKVKAAFAGALRVRPIVGHGTDGAITHDKVRSHEAALDKIIDKVSRHPGEGRLTIMLEHTDNLDWVEQVRTRLQNALEEPADFHLCPLSSTSSVHMGPGTWGVAVTRV